MQSGRRFHPRRTWLRAATILSGLAAAPAFAQGTGQLLPDGQIITPTAAPGAVFQPLNPGLPDHPTYLAGQAVKTVISPDGNTLLVMTSGYNNLNYSNDATSPNYGSFEPSASNEYVFVYDISGKHIASPVVKQVIQVPDTWVGLVFSPDGSKFYVSGGVDDVIYTYSNGPTGWTQTGSVNLGHTSQIVPGTPLSGAIGFYQSPMVCNMALTADGSTLVAVNTYNESISLINTATNTVTTEYDLRPYNTQPATGNGVAGGETDFGVAVTPSGMVYVSSLRDRQIVVLNISSGTPQFVTYIPMAGNPNSMVLDNPKNPTKLYVAQDNSDTVAVINLADNTVAEQIDVIGPPGISPAPERYTGAGTNNLAISANGRTLYVTNGEQNAVAVVNLAGPAPHATVGLIPTGWYPHSVSVSPHGAYLYVSNGKSDPGPNIDYKSTSTYALEGTHYKGGNNEAQNEAYASNEYVFQIEHAGLLTLPVPNATTLSDLTATVAANNGYSTPEPTSSQQTMAALHANIKHVIYIVKENRTFDQVLGDLTNGANGLSNLTVFGRKVTPNFHKAATNFVTLDNFYDPAEVSGNGWEWSTAARETDKNVKDIPMDYAYAPVSSPINQYGYSRGAPYDAEGQNSDVDVGIATLAGRTTAQPEYPLITSFAVGGTANFLPGTNNDAAPDGPDGATQTGYLWDSAVRAGLSIRNYGYFIDLGGSYANVPNPYQLGDIEAYSTNPTLINYTDPYFRSFDNNYPDYWRYLEWNREFQNYVTNGDLPSLTFLRYMHDHMGSFSTAVGGINYPEAQQADDDYAVGLTLQTIAHSRYAKDTLVFVVEDDSQDGPDHVDAHRSTAYIVGPYVKKGAVDSTHYTTVNMIRTIEDILGIDHLNLNDAYAAPMADVFDTTQPPNWNFVATPSKYLSGTVDVTPDATFADTGAVHPAHSAAWWAAQTKGFDWSKEDRVPADKFNRIIWKGFKGNAPYPAVPNADKGTGDND
jgi:DNA-binding beta-propeller fold protein YncE